MPVIFAYFVLEFFSFGNIPAQGKDFVVIIFNHFGFIIKASLWCIEVVFNFLRFSCFQAQIKGIDNILAEFIAENF